MSSLKQMKNRLLAWLAVAMMTGSPALWANELSDISFSTLPGNRVQISLTLSEAIQNPASFATDNPARIAIDLPETTSAVKRKVTPIGVGVTRSVAAIEASDRTRVVINLLESVPYEIRSEGSRLLVDIGGAEGSAQLAVSKPAVAPSASRKATTSFQVANIDFRRGPAGEGRVEIDLSDPSVVVDMRQEGGKIILDLLDTGLPPALARTLDVTDFATPVREILTRPDGRNTRMEIATQGDFEHLAYQAENTYTVEFRELTRLEKEKRQREEKVFEGERLSLNFQDIEVRSVLQLLADFTGLNMVVSDTVGGRLTLRLKNVPWDQAMDIILKTRGLSMRRTDNVILIAPTEEIAAREKLELESQQQIETLAPLRSELIQINYASASELAVLIKSPENRLLTERGSVTVDGDLAEWGDVVWRSMDEVYYGEPKDIGAGLDAAKFALKWNADTNKVYAAVIINDGNLYLEDFPVNWDSSDRIEVYAQGDPNGAIAYGAGGSNYFDKAQQYVIGAGNTPGWSWAFLGAGQAILPSAQFEYAASFSGSQITYEVGATMFIWYGGRSGETTVVRQLEAGMDVGFDVVADTRYDGAPYG